MGVGLAHPAGGPDLGLRLDPDRARAAAGFDYFAIGVPDKAAIDDSPAGWTNLARPHAGVHRASLGWILPEVPDPDGHALRFYTMEHHTDVAPGEVDHDPRSPGNRRAARARGSRAAPSPRRVTAGWPRPDVGRGVATQASPQAIATRARLRQNRSRSPGGSTSVSRSSEAETSRWNALATSRPSGVSATETARRSPGTAVRATRPRRSARSASPVSAAFSMPSRPGQLRHAPRPGGQHAQQPGLGGRQPVAFGRPGESGLCQDGQPDQPVRHRMLPALRSCGSPTRSE